MNSDLRKTLEELQVRHGYSEFWHTIKAMARRRLDKGDRERRRPLTRIQRDALYVRQDGLCAGCHESFPVMRMTDDHIIPLSKGGSDDFRNRRLLCRECNSRKSDKSMVDVSKATGDTIMDQLPKGEHRGE
jgi:5-methylcytosine-specific restriction endonuclease McrA